MEEQKEETALVPVEKKEEEDTTVSHVPFTRDMIVVARTPQDLAKAQAHLVGWVTDKITECEANIGDLQINIDIAKKNHWRVTTLQNQLSRGRKEFIFYKKVKAALEAGYYLVPNFPIDVFAMRTMRDIPKKNVSVSSAIASLAKTESPEEGMGKYIDPDVRIDRDTWTEKNAQGKDVERVLFTATEFQEVSFPFTFARPEVMNATAKALSDKIFDEIGALPGRPRNRTGVGIKGDPMIIGRIVNRNGYHEKVMSFLISWFVDTRDL